MDTSDDVGDDFSLVIDEGKAVSGDEQPVKCTEKPPEQQSETVNHSFETEKNCPVSETIAPVLSTEEQTVSKLIQEIPEKAPQLQPAISPNNNRDATSDGANGNSTGPVEKTSTQLTTTVVDKQSRSTRSSINPDFAAKQRKFLSKVQNAYLHMQTGDTSSCESDSEALPEEQSEDTSPEYVPGAEDSPSRRNSITNINGLKRRREECVPAKSSPAGGKVGTVLNLEEAVTVKSGSAHELESSTGQPAVKRPKTIVQITSEGELTDVYCWYCHREGTNLNCASCPRAYHVRCLRSPAPKGEWVCPECVTILQAETSETRSEAMKMLTLDQLCNLLKFTISRMKSCPGADVFESPVDEKEFPAYREYITNPMDISLLEKNIKNKMYGSTEAFLADASWICHNCIIFNTYQSKFTAVAKNLMRICRQEVAEIEICPDCYLHAHTCEENWFIQVCRKPHTLVWAKLKGFPFWPGKAMRCNSEDCVDVRFFGAHDRAWVPSRDCLLYCQENPNNPSKGPKRKNFKHSLDACVEEVELHIQMLKKQFGEFKYAPLKVQFDPAKRYEQLKMLLPTYNSSETFEIHVPSNPKLIKSISRSSRHSSHEQIESADEEKTNSSIESGPVRKKLKSDANKQHADAACSTVLHGDVIKLPAVPSATDDIARQRLKKRDARKIGLVDRIQEKLSLMIKSSSPDTSECNGVNSSEDGITEDSASEVDKESEKGQMNISDSSVASLREKPNEHNADCIEEKPVETNTGSCVKIKTEPGETSEPLTLDLPTLDGSDLKKVEGNVPLLSPDHLELAKNQPKVVLTKLKLSLKQSPPKAESSQLSNRDESTLKEQDTNHGSGDMGPIKTGVLPLHNDGNSDGSLSITVESVPVHKVKENVIKRSITIRSPSSLSARRTLLPKPTEDLGHKQSPPTWHKIGEGPIGLNEPNVSITVIKEPEPSIQTPQTEEDRNTVKPRNLYPSLPRNVSLSVTRTLMPVGDVSKEPTNNKVVVAGTAQLDPAQQDQAGVLKPTARKTLALRNGPVQGPASSKLVVSPPTSSSVSISTPVSRILQQVPTSVLKSANLTSSDARPASIVLAPTRLTQVIKPTSHSLASAGIRPSSTASCVFVSSPSSCLSVANSGTNTPTTVIPIVRIVPTTIPSSVLTSTTLAVSSPNMLPITTVPSSTMVNTVSIPSATSHAIPIPQQTQVGSVKVKTTETSPNAAVMGPISSELQSCARKVTDIIASTMQGILQDLGSMGNLEAKVRCLQLDLEHLKWRHQLEIDELKHNSELVIAEMRESMKLETQRAVSDALSSANAEKETAVAAAKRRQWCAFCSKEAMFYCCWNTSYCDYTCQVNHWPVHSLSCTQNPCNNVEQMRPLPKKNMSLKAVSSSSLISSTQATRLLPALPHPNSTSSSLPTMKGIPLVLSMAGGATTSSSMTVI